MFRSGCSVASAWSWGRWLVRASSSPPSLFCCTPEPWDPASSSGPPVACYPLWVRAASTFSINSSIFMNSSLRLAINYMWFDFAAAQGHCAMLSWAPWSPNREESTHILWRLLAPSWHTFTPGPPSWCWSRPPSPSSRWAWQSTPPLLSTPAVLLLLWSPSVSQRQRYVSFPTNPRQLIIKFCKLKRHTWNLKTVCGVWTGLGTELIVTTLLFFLSLLFLASQKWYVIAKKYQW